MDGAAAMPKKEQPIHAAPILYKRRWLMVAIFCSYSMTNAFQWLQYPIINDVISRFYDVSTSTTDWLSMIYMLVYIPLIYPVNWLLDRKGLMPVAVLGSFGNALGAIVKVFSASEELFAVTFVGQTISAIAQVFILGIPARLAALWFGPREVATATALGVFGNQVGNAIGFLLPPVLVPTTKPWDADVTQSNLQTMFYLTAAVTTVQFLLVIAVFKGAPETPPSHAQALAVAELSVEAYSDSIKRLLTHKGFMLLFVTYGLNVGSFYAISTLLNQVMLQYFPGADENIGRIGLLIVLSGMVGSVLIGLLIDRTHKYKISTVVIYCCSMLAMLGFTLTLQFWRVMWVMFVVAGLLGFFMTSYLPLGFEFAAEVTYPISEGSSSGLLNASAQFWGIIFTVTMGQIVTRFNAVYANCLLVAALFLGSVLTLFIREDLRRQNAEIETEDAASTKL